MWCFQIYYKNIFRYLFVCLHTISFKGRVFFMLIPDRGKESLTFICIVPWLLVQSSSLIYFSAIDHSFISSVHCSPLFLPFLWYSETRTVISCKYRVFVIGGSSFGRGGAGCPPRPLPKIWRRPGWKFQTIHESLPSLSCKHIVL